jgi:hypothetical protein
VLVLAITPINRYRKAGHPTDDTSPSGGALGSLIVDGEDDFLPKMPIPTVSDLVWYYSEGHRVDNGLGEAAPSPGWYVANGLFKPPIDSVITAVANDATDTGIVRLTFLSAATGEWDTDEITLNGTTNVPGLVQAEADSHIYAERVSGAGALESGVGDTFLYAGGTLLGVILANHSTASSLYKISVGLNVDSTYATPNRLTDPNSDDPSEVGAFVEAFTVATRVQLPGAIDLEDGEFATIWWEVTAPVDMPAPVGQLKPALGLTYSVTTPVGS